MSIKRVPQVPLYREDLVARGVTGKPLEVQGRQRIAVTLYGVHELLIAYLDIREDGILGLDLLRALGTEINIATGEMKMKSREQRINDVLGRQKV